MQDQNVHLVHTFHRMVATVSKTPTGISLYTTANISRGTFFLIRPGNELLSSIDYQAQLPMSYPFFDSISLEIRIIILCMPIRLRFRRKKPPSMLACKSAQEKNKFITIAMNQGRRSPIDTPHMSSNMSPSSKNGPISTHSATRYSEAIDLLYPSNTLVMTRPGTLILLQKLILPQRLHASRFLRLHWWLCKFPPSTPIYVQGCLSD